MSRAGLRVVFPDGVVRCGIYQGTVDVCSPWLYDTDKEAWDDNRPSIRSWDEPIEGEVFDVILYADYGGGFWWHGKAAKNIITQGQNWFDNDLETHDGMPERVMEFYDEQRSAYEAAATDALEKP